MSESALQLHDCCTHGVLTIVIRVSAGAQPVTLFALSCRVAIELRAADDHLASLDYGSPLHVR
jgi:hypothetical protein